MNLVPSPHRGDSSLWPCLWTFLIVTRYPDRSLFRKVGFSYRSGSAGFFFGWTTKFLGLSVCVLRSRLLTLSSSLQSLLPGVSGTTPQTWLTLPFGPLLGLPTHHLSATPLALWYFHSILGWDLKVLSTTTDLDRDEYGLLKESLRAVRDN